jgi:hypothetical protein
MNTKNIIEIENIYRKIFIILETKISSVSINNVEMKIEDAIFLFIDKIKELEYINQKIPDNVLNIDFEIFINKFIGYCQYWIDFYNWKSKQECSNYESRELVDNEILQEYSIYNEIMNCEKIINKLKSNKQTQLQPITIPDSILNELEQEKMITSRKPLQWNKNKIALCAYFVDCYFAKSNPSDLWKVGGTLFNVKNLRQAKNRYLDNKKTSGKPKGYEVIDKILDKQ